MSKILLVYDDFAELNATELTLKKASYDVIGLTNEYTIKDQIVSFNPDILVGFGNTQRVSSLSVGKKIKEMNRWGGKSILIFPKSYAIPADDLIRMRMDMLLETPVSVIRLIQIICKLLKHDERAILEKLAKSFAKDRADALAFSSYDSATVQALQHVQGELASFDPEKIALSGAELAGEIANVTGSNTEPDKKTNIKKSFFEKDTVAPATAIDPFAALISELKGEPLKKTTELKDGNQKASGSANQKQSSDSLDSAADSSQPDSEIDLEKLGERLRKEMEIKSAQLSEKVKKYTAMTADTTLYPESTIKKVKAKSELKRLKEGWNTNELEAQDQSRREFVERLFGSKKDKS